MFAASLPISLGITGVVFSQATPGILISAACRRTCPFDDWEWFVAIKNGKFMTGNGKLLWLIYGYGYIYIDISMIWDNNGII